MFDSLPSSRCSPVAPGHGAVYGIKAYISVIFDNIWKKQVLVTATGVSGESLAIPKLSRIIAWLWSK